MSARQPKRHTYKSTALPPDLMQMLLADAHARGTTVSAMIREIIQGYYYNGGALQSPTVDSTMKEVRDATYRWMRYQLMRVFDDLTESMPEDFMDLKRQASASATDMIVRKRWG